MLVVEAKWEARGPACTELLCRKGVQERGSTGLRPGRRPASRGVAEKTGRAGMEGERCRVGGPRGQDKKLCVYSKSCGVAAGREAEA